MALNPTSVIHKFNEEQSITMVVPKLTPIQEFYNDSVVFITGCTGLVGQLIVEKLLRACPGLSKIFVLIRNNKQRDARTRLEEEVFNCVTFELLNKQCPGFKEKVVAIAGDCSLPGLGISAEDRKILIEQVTVVFHVAASIHFDSKLASAVKTNVRAARDCVILAREMLHLKTMVYTSTIYCNCLEKIVEERVMQSAFNYKDLICLAENLSEELLETVATRLRGKYINPYIFTKQIAEYAVQELSKGLPIGIFRPAIVTSTYLEPVSGWSNNIHGPLGVVRGSLLGVSRISYTNPSINANIVPADMCANAVIVTAWDIAARFQDNPTAAEIPVYNYESKNNNPIVWRKLTEAFYEHVPSYPSIKAEWYPIFLMSGNAVKYHFVIFFLHFVPALLQDTVLLLRGSKPKFLRKYCRLYQITNLLAAFSRRDWTCQTENIQKIISKMSSKDKQLFYMDINDVDWNDYFESFMFGMRVYISKDPMDTLNSAKIKMKRLYWKHQIAKIIAVTLILFIFWLFISLYL